MKYFTKKDGDTTSYTKNGIKTNAGIRLEQDVDLVLKNMELKILGQPHEEVLITTDSRYKYYKANEDCIFHEDCLMFRKCFGETVGIKNYQILVPKHLLTSFSAACMEKLGNSQESPKQ